jgi:lipid-binding SYLF domain-containing protein
LVSLSLLLSLQGILEALASGKKRLCVSQEAAVSIGPLGRNYTKHELPTTTGVPQNVKVTNAHRNNSAGVNAHTGGKRIETTSYSHSRGVYGGVSIQGAVMSVRNDVNLDYYGADVNSSFIIFTLLFINIVERER